MHEPACVVLHIHRFELLLREVGFWRSLFRRGSSDLTRQRAPSGPVKCYIEVDGLDKRLDGDP